MNGSVVNGFREKTYEEFYLGETATFSKTIGEEDILLFAGLSGDVYPLHVDEEYAKTTRFGRRAAHGMLSASLISTVCGLLLQRPGGLLIGQTIRYRRPVFVGDTLTATAEVAELMPDKRRVRCKTTILNQHGDLVVDGEATIQKDPA